MPTERTKTPDRMPEALTLATKDNYLGNPQVIEHLLRQFVAEATERIAKAQTRAEQEEAKIANKASCFHYADIFAGNNPHYVPTTWHHPGLGLIRCIRNQRHINARTPREGVATLLAQLLILTYEGINQAAHGELDAAWQFQFDSMLDDNIRVLSGVGPIPSEEA